MPAPVPMNIPRAALTAFMPGGTRTCEPNGGLALWVELPVGCDSDRVATAAAREGVLVTPGRVFEPNGAALCQPRVP